MAWIPSKQAFNGEHKQFPPDRRPPFLLQIPYYLRY